MQETCSLFIILELVISSSSKGLPMALKFSLWLPGWILNELFINEEGCESVN